MKPSLFFAASLIALAGTAQAAIIFDYQANPGTTTALYDPSVSEGVSITGQTVTNGSGAALLQKTGTNYVNSFLSPNVNVGTGGTWTLTLSFTVTEDVTIDSIALNLFTFNGSNQIQNSNRKGAYTFNLKLGDTVLASCADSSLTYAGTRGYHCFRRTEGQRGDTGAAGRFFRSEGRVFPGQGCYLDGGRDLFHGAFSVPGGGNQWVFCRAGGH